MSLKQNVLKVLEENKGQSISGNKLAKELSVTRTSIWKAINSLRNDGYIIDAVTNKGYCLVPYNKIVSAESIYPFLLGKAKNFHIDYQDKVTSTNLLAKELALNGAKEGTIIIANEQTNGKGRLGRSFYSPANSGVYLSIILRPNLNIEDTLLITTSIAVAVAKAIDDVASVNTGIKWVNDIFIKDKKVCGILTEGAINFENGGLNYAIVGIGINLFESDFPEDIKNIAGSVFGIQDKEQTSSITSKLIAKVLNNIGDAMDSLHDRTYLDEYRKKSILIGKEIKILNNKNIEYGKAIGIDDNAGLLVEDTNGTIITLSSGEVSVRLA